MELGSTIPTSRRPLKTRGRAWARALATGLTHLRVAPNAISAFSLVPAGAAGTCFLLLPHVTAPAQAFLLVLAAGFIQLRLLANMLDGLVAIEGGRKTPTGDLFNEIPDRFADVMILAPVGYAIPSGGWPVVTLGWVAALLAVLTAYVRLFGGSLGFAQSFIGPMAKPHRMATLTLASVLSLIEVTTTGYHGRILLIGLLIIALGSAMTLARRINLIAGQLRKRAER